MRGRRARQSAVPIDPDPRSLDESERGLLDRLLSADFPGVGELRIQASLLLASAPVAADVHPSISWSTRQRPWRP